MFDLEKQIAAWRKEMLAAGLTRPEILDELEGHLREEIRRLVSSGLPEADAFQNAVTELGDGNLLKQEFAKVGRRKPFTLRDNPLALNLIGTWFIIAGLNAVTSLRAFSNIVTPFTWRVIPILLTLVVCSQLLIGVGLLRRKNVCRGLAVGWSRWALILNIWSLLFAHYVSVPVKPLDMPTLLKYASHAGGTTEIYALFASGQLEQRSHLSSLGIATIGMSSHHSLQYMFLGMPLPIAFLQIISWLNVGMLVWAYYLFTQSRVRDLFHPAAGAGAN
jgi:hypothetical protein